MALKPLAERLESLPRILVGPMLRRVEPEGATVSLALRSDFGKDRVRRYRREHRGRGLAQAMTLVCRNRRRL